MSPPPTSIDGTDITGATIDGQDVDSITIDGQEVFSSGPNLPVGFSNLVAWYPFDPDFYGGSASDDVTAKISGSGDSTAYDFTNNGATHLSSGGATDINDGSNSGNFDLSQASPAFLDRSSPIFTGSSNLSICAFVKPDSISSNSAIFLEEEPGGKNRNFLNFADRFKFDSFPPSGGTLFTGKIVSTGVYQHVAVTVSSSSEAKLYVNGTVEAQDNNFDIYSGPTPDKATVGLRQGNNSQAGDYQIDDLRLYNRDLSQSEINTIIGNTQP